MNATRLTEPQDESLPYRNLMCKVIEQACQWARGKDMAEYLNDCGIIGTAYQQRKVEETALAIEYLKSDQFEDDCGYLSINPEKIRKEVLKVKVRKQHEISIDGRKNMSKGAKRYQSVKVWYRQME
jgi:hypothetical protein